MSDRQEVMKAIDTAIQKAALDGALTQDAIEQFQGILTENGELRALRTSNAKQITELKEELEETKKRLLTADNELMGWNGREQDLLTREQECMEKEVRAECATQRVADHQRMMEVIFKPAGIRKELWSSIPGFDEHGYPNASTGNQNESGTITEE